MFHWPAVNRQTRAVVDGQSCMKGFNGGNFTVSKNFKLTNNGPTELISGNQPKQSASTTANHRQKVHCKAGGCFRLPKKPLATRYEHESDVAVV